MKRKLLICLAVAVVFALALPLAGCAKPAETLTLPESASEESSGLTRGSIYADKAIICRDCGEEFVFTVDEQAFYAEKGFQSEPVRCKACRQGRQPDRPGHEMFTAICAQCGAETQIPFQPKDDRPVYCPACYQARRES